MSFTFTPLGSNQNRRVDRNTFFNKPQSQPLIRLPIPTSNSSRAPAVTRSPPRQPYQTHQQDTPDEPALVRFAKQKQRATTSTLDPERWSVRDTSVRIANALSQAATGDTTMPPTNPNDAWASGIIRKPNVPRSTSVEYESESHSTTIRRLNGPPPSNRNSSRRNLVKSTSIQHVPDSEDERPEPVTQLRGKSPFEHVADVARTVLKPATFFMVRRSQDPEEVNGKDGSSYDYTEEEQLYQAQQLPPPSSAIGKRPTHPRGRISIDNKAYRPSASDLEQSDEDFEDEDKKVRKRKKSKKDSVGGPLTSLPVAGYDKRRKRKKNTKGGEDENDEEYDDEDESRSDDQGILRASAHQVSGHLTTQPPRLRTSVPHYSLPPEPYDTHDRSPEGDTSIDVEQGLHSIPEVDESFGVEFDHTSPSNLPATFSIGGFLGRIVNLVIRSVLVLCSSVFRLLGYMTWGLGQLVGAAFTTPKRLLSSTGFVTLVKLVMTAMTAYLIWHFLKDSSLPNIAWSSSHALYQPPSIPASDLAELSARLQALEAAVSSLSLNNERSRLRLENELNRGNSDLSGRLDQLETKVQKDHSRGVEAESQFRQITGQGIQAVKQEIETLRSQIASVPPKHGDDGSEETRSKLKLLEERIGSVEGGMKEALEMGKSSVKIGTSAAWWNRLGSGNLGSTFTIKTTDGQDVTSMISHLVDSATSKYSKDVIARPDFALHSGGAQVIPSLTSATYEIRPVGAAKQVVGFVTGTGHAIGRPPVTALHHDINNGHCWPLAGFQGHLGVKLAWPVIISDVTIDHVANDVAFDMRSAPREMELWGLVEGKDNIGKFKAWLAERRMRREEALAAGQPVRPEDKEWVYPKGLPKNAQYARITSFTYDINSPANIQTFPVTQDLGVDFGVVVLFINNNWGREEFTCLYRLRVHGDKAGEIPTPYNPETDS